MAFRKASGSQDLNAYLGPDLHIQGDLSFKGTVRFEGHLQGKLQGEKVIIGDTGAIEGELEAQEIQCAGKIQGLVRAQTVHLYKTACFKGELQAQSLAVEEGAQIEGQLKVGPQTRPSKAEPEVS